MEVSHSAAPGPQGSFPLCYLAYPTSLTLQAANAIQTYLTVRALRERHPDLLVIVPRLLREPSAFAELGAVHLPRLPVGKLSRLFPSTGWYYLERTLFAWMVAGFLFFRRLRGRGCRAVYVREVICAYWLSGFFRHLTGARLIYEAHELESRNPSRARGRLWQPLLERLDRTLLRRADGVVSLTETFARELEERSFRPAARTAVLPDAYDEELYRPLERASCRKALGLPADGPILAYAGLTFSYRGLDLLLEALAGLAPRFPALRLELVGGRPAEIAALEKQARALGVEGRVHFRGSVPRVEVPRYLGAADVLVIPGTVSGASASPLKMFEYMAMGRPIVCVDIPALREVLDDDAAYFFPPGDAPALARAVEAALTRPEEAARKGERARLRASAYTYGRRAERLLEIVRDALGSP
ncbi:MAG: glycosyltransferase [Chloroflexia bacterium]